MSQAFPSQKTQRFARLTIPTALLWTVILGASLAYTEARSNHHGSDYLQGYLFGKPEPAKHWTERLQQ